ncbi:hypothetical protein HYALB_00009417 [Hymenoscyphus albidus]|uniref:Uncharacterized protein n=1 Tax=Hymenoscyphus albidus TaxID=595503 RepID=A0A9N9LNC5_9HELO|nr:hypothetical protein HYALB_00009417 [Hymenoscyphus albidus]
MPPPRRSKASGSAFINCPPPPENDSEAHTLGIYKLSITHLPHIRSIPQTENHSSMMYSSTMEPGSVYLTRICLGFSNPTYNHTIRSLSECKVRIALKNQKARLQQEFAFYRRPMPPTLDPEHKYSWAQWMIDNSITDQDKKRSKSFYDVEMILRASVHAMAPDEIGKLQEYLELGRKGCDIQEWFDSRRNIPPDTESVPSTNSSSTGKRDRALSSSNDSASNPRKQHRIV